MSSELDKLYGEIILDHQREPRNYGTVEHCDHREEGYNPLCGDRITLTFKFDDAGKVVKTLAFEGQGCSISMASASILTEEVQGKSIDDALKQVSEFRELMQGNVNVDDIDSDVKALSGVRRFPVRIKCALLPWMTLKRAIEVKTGLAGETGPVSTEDTGQLTNGTGRIA